MRPDGASGPVAARVRFPGVLGGVESSGPPAPAGGADAPGLRPPHGVMPVAGAHARVRDLVEDRLADLGLVVQPHEVARERDPATRVVGLPGSSSSAVQVQLPVLKAVGRHE